MLHSAAVTLRSTSSIMAAGRTWERDESSSLTQRQPHSRRF